MVVDLRGNPGGLLVSAVQTANLFLPEARGERERAGGREGEAVQTANLFLPEARGERESRREGG